MSEIDVVLHAYPRIYFACHVRHVRDPASGASMSAHQASILSHLDEEDPTMVGELADHLGVTPSTMSLTLRRLERAGFVHKNRDPADRRVMNVRLTEAGVRIRDAQTVLDAERVAEMLNMLGPEDRPAALRGLRLLADAADRLVRRDKDTVNALTAGEAR
jgi:DNA-binding MarR family transcriptional regulator